MAKIHLIDGEKGGVGKSFFAKTLVEYFLEAEIPYTLIDADRTNPDVYRLYSEGAHQIIFSDLEEKFHQTDIIFESALEKPVIVSLPAQIANLLQGWLERSNILETGAENGIEICRWFVSNGSYDSIQLFKKSMDYYGDKISNVLVKNLGLTSNWDFLAENVDFMNLCGKYRQTLKIIELAKCNYKERYDLEELQMTLSEALSSDKFKILPKQRLLNFKRASFQEIASTGLIEKPAAEMLNKSPTNNSSHNNGKKHHLKKNNPQPPQGVSQVSKVEVEKESKKSDF